MCKSAVAVQWCCGEKGRKQSWWGGGIYKGSKSLDYSSKKVLRQSEAKANKLSSMFVVLP